MVVSAVAAFAVTVALAFPVTVLLQRLGVLDLPNDRSSHVRPTLRGGGIAPAAGTIVGVLASTQLTGAPRLAVLVSACSFGLVGLAEDLAGLPVSARLLLQVACAVATLPWLASHLGGPTLWRVVVTAVVVLWLVAYVNAFNFMDGIDGVSVAQAVVAGLAWCAVGLADDVPALAVGGVAVAAAAAGFAPFNLPTPRLFLGDTGSYFLGGFLAVLMVVGLRLGVPPEAMIGPLVVYLADTGSTLLRRIVRGEVWYLPHREHVYQRLVRGGWSHARTTVVVGAWIALCSALGALSVLRHPVGIRAAADVALVAAAAGYLALPGVLRSRGATSYGVGAAPGGERRGRRAAPHERLHHSSGAARAGGRG